MLLSQSTKQVKSTKEALITSANIRTKTVCYTFRFCFLTKEVSNGLGSIIQKRHWAIKSFYHCLHYRYVDFFRSVFFKKNARRRAQRAEINQDRQSIWLSRSQAPQLFCFNFLVRSTGMPCCAPMRQKIE